MPVNDAVTSRGGPAKYCAEKLIEESIQRRA
jgi:hypothetical protein